MIVRTGPEAEAGLRKLGFTIPVRPKTGEVKYEGKVVGWIDNFTGLRIENKNLKVCQIVADNAKQLQVGLWNIPDGVVKKETENS